MSGMGCLRLLAAVGFVAGAAGLARAAEPYAQPSNTQPAYAQPAISDATITSDIKAKLEANKLLRHATVTIASSGGVVTLVGTVPSDFAREQAIEAVRSTPGVVRYDDQLRLEISSPAAPTRN